MGVAKVTRNYQVTIPKDIRRTHGIKIGDTVFFAMEGKKVDFFKMSKEDIIKETAGSWKNKLKEKSTTYVKKIREEWN